MFICYLYTTICYFVAFSHRLHVFIRIYLFIVMQSALNFQNDLHLLLFLSLFLLSICPFVPFFSTVLFFQTWLRFATRTRAVIVVRIIKINKIKIKQMNLTPGIVVCTPLELKLPLELRLPYTSNSLHTA